jgi:hypothetical protein
LVLAKSSPARIIWAAVGCLAAGLILFTVFLAFFAPYTASISDDLNVSADQSFPIYWTNLYEETKFEGYFTIRNGNEEPDFSFYDPRGATIHDAGTVHSRLDFFHS